MMAAEKPVPEGLQASGGSADGNANNGLDRRDAPRILVNLEVDYASQDNFLFAYIKDISATGIFVHTDRPQDAGTHLNLRFRLPDDNDVIDIEGKVIWVNAYRPGRADSLNPGMGIRFVGLNSPEVVRLRQLVTTFALLDEEER